MAERVRENELKQALCQRGPPSPASVACMHVHDTSATEKMLSVLVKVRGYAYDKIKYVKIRTYFSKNKK